MNVLKTALPIAMLLFAFAFLILRLTGYDTLVITGGSMEPTIHKGSVVLVQAAWPNDVRMGDVITFVFYGQTTTHRAIGIDATADGLAFTTKGDANAAADPEPKLFPGQVGIVRAVVPFLGYVLVYARAYAWVALGLAAVVVFIISFADVRRSLAARQQPRRSRA